MILPIKFLWEQLDGPQANAIEQAIYEYWKQMFDEKLDYLNNINIESANDAHLTLLGIIANFIRPNILVPDKDYFLFTEHAESDNPHGLSFVNNRAVGGRLTAISGPEQGPYPLDTEFYRTLLKTYRDSDGEIDSLVLLDDICNALSLKDNPTVQPSYEFSFTRTTTEVTGRGPGDLYIDMGSMSHWANPLQIYAVLTGLANSVFWPLPCIWTSLDTDIRTHTPSPNIQGGTYGEPITIELSCSTAGASIIYTLDGSEPFQDTGLLYTEPIEITDTTLLRVRAYKAELEPSFEFSAQYIISTNIQLPEVMSSVASGLYTGDISVELNCPFGLPTVIRYTLDGTEPTESSPEYTGPLTTTGNMLLKAKAFRGTSYLPSNTTTYDIRVMPQPVIIGPDIWTQAPLVTLTCATEGVTILYSTDGNAPRTEYAEPFYLYETATVKAIATKAGYTDSILSEKVFSITSVQPVQASLPAGGYIGTQSVILYCATPSAIIRYTLDGSEPTEASNEYAGPITIPVGITTLKAKAWKGELVPTEVGTWEYIVRNTMIVAEGNDGLYTSADGLSYTKVLNNNDVTLTFTDNTTWTLDGRLKLQGIIDIQLPTKVSYILIRISRDDADGGYLHAYRPLSSELPWTEDWTIIPQVANAVDPYHDFYYTPNVGIGVTAENCICAHPNSSSEYLHVLGLDGTKVIASQNPEGTAEPPTLLYCSPNATPQVSGPTDFTGFNYRHYFLSNGDTSNPLLIGYSCSLYSKDVHRILRNPHLDLFVFAAVHHVGAWDSAEPPASVLTPQGSDVIHSGVGDLAMRQSSNADEQEWVCMGRDGHLYYSKSRDGSAWVDKGVLPLPEGQTFYWGEMIYDSESNAFIGTYLGVENEDTPNEVIHLYNFRITNPADLTTIQTNEVTQEFTNISSKQIYI